MSPQPLRVGGTDPVVSPSDVDVRLRVQSAASTFSFEDDNFVGQEAIIKKLTVGERALPAPWLRGLMFALCSTRCATVAARHEARHQHDRPADRVRRQQGAAGIGYWRDHRTLTVW